VIFMQRAAVVARNCHGISEQLDDYKTCRRDR
jgi:hypothetical protein